MTWEILKNLGIFGVFVLMIFVVRARRKQYRQWLDETSDQWVCEHLAGALEQIKKEGHMVARLDQRHEEAPLEILIDPPVDLKQLAVKLNIQEPVKLSERNVIYCEECGVEIGNLLN